MTRTQKIILVFVIFYVFYDLGMYILEAIDFAIYDSVSDYRDTLLGAFILALLINFFIPEKTVKKNKDIKEEIINDNLNKFNIINN